jgi:hypothetical protein
MRSVILIPCCCVKAFTLNASVEQPVDAVFSCYFMQVLGYPHDTLQLKSYATHIVIFIDVFNSCDSIAG